MVQVWTCSFFHFIGDWGGMNWLGMVIQKSYVLPLLCLHIQSMLAIGVFGNNMCCVYATYKVYVDAVKVMTEQW